MKRTLKQKVSDALYAIGIFLIHPAFITIAAIVLFIITVIYLYHRLILH